MLIYREIKSVYYVLFLLLSFFLSNIFKNYACRCFSPPTEAALPLWLLEIFID